MILCFPNLDTLRLALTSGAVPAKLSEAPVQAGLDEKDRLWLQAATDPSKSVLTELRRLGAQAYKSSPIPLDLAAGCWLQLLPVQRSGELVAVTDKAPVLFDLPAAQLAPVVSEMLRLGNDRQSFRYLEDSKAAPGTERALLRVIGPPYYTLLRALDRDGQADALVAYIEAASRVWVQIGYQHSLGPQIKPPANQVLLLRPPRQWTYLADGTFRDIYEVLEFQLPQAPAGWNDAKVTSKLKVPLRLGQGAGTDVAELWVLRERAFEQLDQLVHDTGDDLLARLDFAVGDRDGQQVIVLRVRPSKQEPPALSLQAVEFRSHPARLTNLYLPCRTALVPPLRRDAVRKLLAEDLATITWLYPTGDGQFIPETLPDSAFRPLSDWIDYVLEHDRKALELWVQSAQFDFESFVCKDDQTDRPPKPKSGDRTKTGKRPINDNENGASPEPARPAQPAKKPRRQVEKEDDFVEVVEVEASIREKRERLRALEERFRGLEGSPEDVEKERRVLWPELAELNADLDNLDEAGLCWMNAFWGAERPDADWSWQWLRAEARAVPARQEKGQSRPRSWAELPAVPADQSVEISAADLDRLLALPDPKSVDLRTLVAYLVFATARSPHPPAVLQRLNPLRQFLEAQEHLLPVRAVWLAWLALARLSGGDVLALARARDRLLQRLFGQGLKLDQDLPRFLRFAGRPDNQRFRDCGKWLGDKLHDLARRWQEQMPGGDIFSGDREPRTAQYLDLMFAFGLARLSEGEASRRLLEEAKHELGEETHDAHRFLLEAFAYRIQQAQEGKRGGPLPAEQMEYLANLATEIKERKERKEPNQVWPDYVIDRMRALSRILEPDQKVDPYRDITGRTSALDGALAELPDILDRDELAGRVRQLLKKPPEAKDLPTARARILRVALDQAPRVGEAFSVELLGQVPATFDALPQPRPLPSDQFELRARLLEKALFVAAHFDQGEQVQQLADRFEQLLESLAGSEAVKFLDELTTQCFRGLRKLGMRDVIDRLLRKMAERILEGQDLASLSVEWAAAHPAALQVLLHVAAGWIYFTRHDEAEPVLQLARDLLFSDALKAKEKTRLACVYAATLGQASQEVAQRRIEELFAKLEGIRDNFTTSQYYAWLQLEIIEAVVLAVVSDNFLLGADARRWLDDDEYLVRRRIHQDVKSMMTV